MADEWDDFLKLARAWAKDGVRDPRLPAKREDFLALAYERWLAAPGGDTRRTLESFENLLTALYGTSIPSIYRKLKGTIRPREEELARLLAALFVSGGQRGSRPKASDRAAAEALADHLTKRLCSDEPDLTEDTTSVRIIASQGSLVHGPDDHARDQTFRDLMGRRLFETRQRLVGPGAPEVPLTIWVIDVSPLWDNGEAGHDSRRALMGLASSLMAALATEWSPPRKKASLEFEIERLTSLPTNVRIGLRSGRRTNDGDLGHDLHATSVVCLVGYPVRKQREEGELELELEGEVEGDFFRQALMPDSIITHDNLAGSIVQKERISKLLDLTGQREVSLVTALPLQRVHQVADCITGDIGELDRIQESLKLEPLHYVYWYEESGDKAKVKEELLSNMETPPSMETALFAILVAAAAELTKRELAPKSIGQQLADLVANNGVKVLTINQFLNFADWFNEGRHIVRIKESHVHS